MCGSYVLEWLDTLVSVTLNPVKTDLNLINTMNLTVVSSKIEREKLRIQSQLKEMVFYLGNEEKIKLLVKQYHSDLTILLDQALENQLKYTTKLSELKELTSSVATCIDELLSFIEIRFGDYLSLDERVSATYLTVSKKGLKQKFNRISTKFKGDDIEFGIINLVVNELNLLVGCSKKEHLFNFKELSYMRDVCKELEYMDYRKNESSTIYTCLDKLLICFNFNSKRYIDNFIRRIAEKIDEGQDFVHKTEILLLHLKVFKQMYRKHGVIFDGTCVDLDTQVSNWFAEELFFLEKKLRYATLPMSDHSERSPHKNGELLKVLCKLSVDQLAIVLRCVDELKILMSRSLNAVFKSIVPHLSTPCQENISYDSMRSKSYAVETRDKDVVIGILEQMINKIRGY